MAAAVLAWIGAVLLLDAAPLTSLGPLGPFGTVGGAEPARQIALGAATWAVLALALRREDPLTRTQTLLVVLFATLVEYTFSPLLHAYTYRIGTVPGFVPPGHGLVYLAALLIGRRLDTTGRTRIAVAAVAVAGSAWAAWGLLSPRHDVLGAFWFACLAGFLRWGPNRGLYAGAFVVVGYLELAGTALGTWAWAPADPVLHVIGQGNPPSGAAGGYGWFDLWAVLLAPSVLLAWSGGLSRLRTSRWSRALVATASPPKQPSSPASDVNRPPASTTIGTSAAMSYSWSDGSQAMSTAPSATSMYDQKSP
jgi:hypothetical protein